MAHPQIRGAPPAPRVRRHANVPQRHDALISVRVSQMIPMPPPVQPVPVKTTQSAAQERMTRERDALLAVRVALHRCLSNLALSGLTLPRRQEREQARLATPPRNLSRAFMEDDE